MCSYSSECSTFFWRERERKALNNVKLYRTKKNFFLLFVLLVEVHVLLRLMQAFCCVRYQMSVSCISVFKRIFFPATPVLLTSRVSCS